MEGKEGWMVGRLEVEHSAIGQDRIYFERTLLKSEKDRMTVWLPCLSEIFSVFHLDNLIAVIYNIIRIVYYVNEVKI